VTQLSSPRKSAEERREQILQAALIEFAERGLYGTSTDDIARRVGVSQPYLFRLFGTKKELYVAAVERCMEETLAMMRRAAGGKVGEDALHAIGRAYGDRLRNDPLALRLQMNAYVACNEPEVCAVMRKGYGRLVEFAEQASGAPPTRITEFFSFGMLLNVVASMGLLESDEPWARRLLAGCDEQLD
jgi:AcrR family transcriptional regulator